MDITIENNHNNEPDGLFIDSESPYGTLHVPSSSSSMRRRRFLLVAAGIALVVVVFATMTTTGLKGRGIGSNDWDDSISYVPNSIPHDLATIGCRNCRQVQLDTFFVEGCITKCTECENNFSPEASLYSDSPCHW